MKKRLIAMLCLIALALTVFTGAAPKAEENGGETFPSRYDPRELGLVTEVKDQGVYGTCWAFAIASVLESNALLRGYGKFDLSEYQLAYMCMHAAQDGISFVEGEGPECSGSWFVGPYGAIMSSSLLRGCAIRTEEEFPYSMIEEPLPDDGFSADGALYVDSCYTVPNDDPNALKELIVENGAFYTNICALSWIDESGDYCNWDTGAAYFPKFTDKYAYIDHFVTIVGWDEKSATVFIGLPGHPVSAMTVFDNVLLGWWRQTTGQEARRPVFARLDRNVMGAGGKETYQPVRLHLTAEGWLAEPVFYRSGLISALAAADGFFVLERNREGLSAGEQVLVYLY